MDLNVIVELAYLLSAILFVVGLKRMQSPATARKGNGLAALAMLVAIVATLVDQQILDWTGILIGMIVGGLVGVVLAKTVKMTSMPELVGAFNGFGGGASALVAAAEFTRIQQGGVALEASTGAVIALSLLIGTLTFSGSFVAFGKLNGMVTGNPVTYPGDKLINGLIFAAIIALGVMIAMGATAFGLSSMGVFLALTVLAFLIGILLVIPIGGADMPVVISLLNSYSGLAASAAGFVVGNMVLIISGALVGAAGLFLTFLMCKAMNRSLTNVIFGAFGQEGGTAAAGATGDKPVKSVDAEQAAMVLGYAQSVIVVPGYGLAVAQAQHELRKLMDLLQDRDIDVKYAVHPVAGRMPGHMNVLLAEADVPYDQLYDLDEINDDFARTDVVVLVGANDVVNPEARNPDSIIAGMPILDVDKAKNVIVIKRSLSPGFAGIDNPLFYMDKTMMFFSDAKEAVQGMSREVKEL